MKRKMSRMDRNIVRKEIEDEKDFKQEEEKYFLDQKNKLDIIFRKHFPDLFSQFEAPSFDYLIEHYGLIANISTDFDKSVDSNNTDAFLFACVIRYIDNFIDEVIWPYLRSNKKNIEDSFENTFSLFIDEVYNEAQKTLQYLPKEIINLPKIEVQLFLHPDQDTFDNLFKTYIYNKSYNLAYLDFLITKKHPAEMSMWNEDQKDEYILKALWDISRDTYNDNLQSDFDILQHIKSNDLDAKEFIQVIYETIKTHSPSLYDVVKHKTNYLSDSNISMVYDALETNNIDKQKSFLLLSIIELLISLEE